MGGGVWVTEPRVCCVGPQPTPPLCPPGRLQGIPPTRTLPNDQCWLKQDWPQDDPPHPPRAREFGAPGWVRGRVKVTEVTYPGG